MKGHLIAGLLACAAAGGAAMAGSGTISAENLAYVVGPTTYRLARISVEGSTLTPAVINRIFDSTEQALSKDRFAPLTASRIVIPEISGETETTGLKQKFVYRDVVFENVTSGRIGKARAASFEQTADIVGRGRVESRYGSINARNVDLVQLAHIYSESSSADKEPIKTVQDEISLENIAVTAPESRLELRVARIRAQDIKGRATRRPLGNWFADANAASSAPASEQAAALVVAALDAMGAFEIGLLEAQEVSGSTAGAKPVAITIKHAALGKIANSAIGEGSLEDLSFSSTDGSKVVMRHAAMRGLELRPLFDLSGARFPRIAHIDLAGLDANMPDPSAAEAAREKLRIASGSLDLGAYRDNSPTQVSSRVEHCVIDLSERAGAPADAQLIALGYKEVDLSWTLDGEWREKEQEIALRQASLEGKDMGRIELSAQLSNVSPLLFSPVPALAHAAAITAEAKRVDANFENMTLIDRTIAAEASSKGVDPLKLRSEYAGAATLLISTFFDNNEKARPLATAIGAFIQDPRKLRVTLQSAKGVSLLSAMMSKPSDVLQSVDIEAKATK